MHESTRPGRIGATSQTRVGKDFIDSAIATPPQRYPGEEEYMRDTVIDRPPNPVEDAVARIARMDQQVYELSERLHTQANTVFGLAPEGTPGVEPEQPSRDALFPRLDNAVSALERRMRALEEAVERNCWAD